MAKTPLDELGLIDGNDFDALDLLALTDASTQRGSTADRPTGSRRFPGKLYYDTTISALLMWNGSVWIPVYDLQQDVFFTFGTPGTTLSATSTGSFVDWITVSSAVAVPTWATKADVRGGLTSVFNASSGGEIYAVRATLGGQAGTFPTYQSMFSSLSRFNIPIIDRITLSGSGTQTLKIQAARVSGTNVWQIDNTVAANSVGLHVRFTA